MYIILRIILKIKMGGRCNNCGHWSCINGDSGVEIWGECIKCEKYIRMCSNNLTDKELDKRSNEEACGCGDKERDDWICNDCR